MVIVHTGHTQSLHLVTRRTCKATRKHPASIASPLQALVARTMVQVAVVAAVMWTRYWTTENRTASAARPASFAWNHCIEAPADSERWWNKQLHLEQNLPVTRYVLYETTRVFCIILSTNNIRCTPILGWMVGNSTEMLYWYHSLYITSILVSSAYNFYHLKEIFPVYI